MFDQQTYYFQVFTNLRNKTNSAIVFSHRHLPTILKYRGHRWDLPDPGNYSMMSRLPLIWKDYACSHAWSCGLCEEGTSFYAGLVSRKLWGFLRFQLALLHSLSYFFCRYRSPSPSCIIFDAISFNIDEFFWINPSANLLISGDFNIHHKDWLTYTKFTLMLFMRTG